MSADIAAVIAAIQADPTRHERVMELIRLMFVLDYSNDPDARRAAELFLSLYLGCES